MSATAEAQAGPKAAAAKGWSLPPWWEKALFPVFLLVAIVFLERVRFEFAPGSRMITWRRRWALRQRSGSIPFGSIQSILVERPIGDEGTPSRRIVLKTISGEDIPITVGYRPDADGLVLKTASRLRAHLGHDSDATHMDNVKALIAAAMDLARVPLPSKGKGNLIIKSDGAEKPPRRRTSK